MEHPSVQCRFAAQLCPTQPLAQPQPTLWGGGWAELGKKESPKAGGQEADSYFLSIIKEKGLVSVRTASHSQTLQSHRATAAATQCFQHCVNKVLNQTLKTQEVYHHYILCL